MDDISGFLSNIRLGGPGKAQGKGREDINSILKELGLISADEAGQTILGAIKTGLADVGEVASNADLSPAPSPPQQRPDGSIAGRFNPLVNAPGSVGGAVKDEVIEPRARKAVESAQRRGYKTVSSGYDAERNVGWAIGKDPKGGALVRIEEEPDPIDTDGQELLIGPATEADTADTEIADYSELNNPEQAPKGPVYDDPDGHGLAIEPVTAPGLSDAEFERQAAAEYGRLANEGPTETSLRTSAEQRARFAPPIDAAQAALLQEAILNRLQRGKPIPAALHKPSAPSIINGVEADVPSASPFDNVQQLELRHERRILHNMRNEGKKFPEIIAHLQKIQALPLGTRELAERMELAGRPYNEIKKLYVDTIKDIEKANEDAKDGTFTYIDTTTGAKYEHTPGSVTITGGLVGDEPQTVSTAFAPQPGRQTLSFSDEGDIDTAIIDNITRASEKYEELRKHDPMASMRTPEGQEAVRGLIAKTVQAEEATKAAIIKRASEGWKGWLSLATAGVVSPNDVGDSELLNKVYRNTALPLGRAATEFVSAGTAGALNVEEIARHLGLESSVEAQHLAAGKVGDFAAGAGSAAGILLPFGGATKTIEAGANALARGGAAARTIAGGLNLAKGPLSFAMVDTGSKFVQNIKDGKSAFDQLDEAAVEGAKSGLLMGLLQYGNALILGGLNPSRVKQAIESVMVGAEFTAIKDPQAFQDPAFLAGTLSGFAAIGALHKPPSFKPVYRADLFRNSPAFAARIESKLQEMGVRDPVVADKMAREEFVRLTDAFHNPQGKSEVDVIAAKTMMNELLATQRGQANADLLKLLFPSTYTKPVFDFIGKQMMKIMPDMLASTGARAGSEAASLLREARASARSLGDLYTMASAKEFDGFDANSRKAIYEAHTKGQDRIFITDTKGQRREVDLRDITHAPPILEEALRPLRVDGAPSPNEYLLRKLYLAKRLGLVEASVKPDNLTPGESLLYDRLADRRVGLGTINRQLSGSFVKQRVAQTIMSESGQGKVSKSDIGRLNNIPGSKERVDEARSILLDKDIAEASGEARFDKFYNVFGFTDGSPRVKRTAANGKKTYFTKEDVRAIFNRAGGNSDPLGADRFEINWERGGASDKLRERPLVIDSEKAKEVERNAASVDATEAVRLLAKKLSGYRPLKDGQLTSPALKDMLFRDDFARDIEGVDNFVGGPIQNLTRLLRTAKVGLSIGGAVRDYATDGIFGYWDLGIDAPLIYKASGRRIWFGTKSRLGTLPTTREIYELRRALTGEQLNKVGEIVEGARESMLDTPDGWKLENFKGKPGDDTIIEGVFKDNPLWAEYKRRFPEKGEAATALLRDLAIAEDMFRSGTLGSSYTDVELDWYDKRKPKLKEVIASTETLGGVTLRREAFEAMRGDARELVLDPYMKDGTSVSLESFQEKMKQKIKENDAYSRTLQKKSPQEITSATKALWEEVTDIIIQGEKNDWADADITTKSGVKVNLSEVLAPEVTSRVNLNEQLMKMLKLGVDTAIGGGIPKDKLIALRSMPDNYTKGGAYLAHLYRGRTMRETSQRISKNYPNYDNVPHGLQNLGRYTGGIGANFFSEAMRITWNTAKDHPWRIITARAIPPALAALAQSYYGISDEEMEELRAKYGSMVIPLGKDDKGSRAVIDMTNIFPAADVFQNTFRPADRASSMFGPPGVADTLRREEGIPSRSGASGFNSRLKPLLAPYIEDNIAWTIADQFRGKDNYGREIPDDERLGLKKGLLKTFEPAIWKQWREIYDAIFSPKAPFGVEQTPAERIAQAVRQVGPPVQAMNPKRERKIADFQKDKADKEEHYFIDELKKEMGIKGYTAGSNPEYEAEKDIIQAKYKDIENQFKAKKARMKSILEENTSDGAEEGIIPTVPEAQPDPGTVPLTEVVTKIAESPDPGLQERFGVLFREYRTLNDEYFEKLPAAKKDGTAEELGAEYAPRIIKLLEDGNKILLEQIQKGGDYRTKNLIGSTHDGLNRWRRILGR